MKAMKKLSAFFLVFAVLFTSALYTVANADEVTDYIRSLGLDPEISNPSGNDFHCDYSQSDSANAMMEWSDAEHLYSISGNPADISCVYIDCLSLQEWNVCRYIVNDRVMASYGEVSDNSCATLEEYISNVKSALDTQTSATSESTAILYILNTNSKKFHYPDCSSVGKIKNNNRGEFSGTRDELIAQGYSPCGNCNP